MNTPARICAALLAGALVVILPVHAQSDAVEERVFDQGSFVIRLNESLLRASGLSVTSNTEEITTSRSRAFAGVIDEDSDLNVARLREGIVTGINGSLSAQGAILILDGDRRVILGNPGLMQTPDGRWSLVTRPFTADGHRQAFRVINVMIDAPRRAASLRIAGELIVHDDLALALERPHLKGQPVGTLVVEAETVRDSSPAGQGSADGAAAVAGSIGPDVIVGTLPEMNSYGTLANIAAFSVGTISCNAGDEPLNWYPFTDQHPVIGQHMYRYKDGRFEQIGMSWVKHGFSALEGNECGFGCIEPPDPGHQLGVGCSDPYSANLNGTQGNLGPRADINVTTGEFPYPYSAPGATPIIGRRLQVPTHYLNVLQNLDAEYFVDAHYVTQDDAAAGNQHNNFSWRRITITSTLDGYVADFTPEITRREEPAIRAWKQEDPSVLLNGAFVINDGIIWVGSRATDLGNGFWEYEYALQNVTSHRSVRLFRIDLQPGVTAQSPGFHDVPYHSGDPFDGTDWTPTIDSSKVEWSTFTFAQNPNANAIRWGTLYNFRFQANTPPEIGTVTLGMFRPGTPSSTTVGAYVPAAPVPICGDGQIGTGEQCDPPDGFSCDGDCQWVCGDGIVQEPETCDPPNGSTCDAACQIIYICGDGMVDPDEDCDPPNGVTCDDNCQRIPICGDSLIDAGEECDPPNHVTCDDDCARIDIDSCASAVAICPGSYLSTTSSNTNDGVATCGDSDASPDVWFRYEPLVDGILELSTCNGGLNTVLSVHSDCSGSPLAELACNDNACGYQSSLAIAVETGESYLIRLAGVAGASGAFRLDVSGPECLTGPVVNDGCGAQVAIDEGGTPFTTLQSDTDGPDESSVCGSPQEGDIWYCYTPSCSGMATVSLCDADFDSVVSVYDGCACPENPEASTCNDDACGAQSEVAFPVVAGASKLIRIAGKNGERGAGTVEITCTGDGDPIRGGQLWDEWWVVNGADIPTGDHPLYPAMGEQSGSVTWRCMECHGWDYEGVDGVYSSGPHFTGIPGVLGSGLSTEAMFDLVRGSSLPNGHGFEGFGLTHQDVWDVVAFVEGLAVDTAPFIDGGGAFLGDPVEGETNFTTQGAISCIFCHGSDGTNINFGSESDPAWLGTIANEDPWQMLHKIRFGEPGSPMPSWEDWGGAVQGAADIGAYAQQTFPVDCLTAFHCDDGLYCNGEESCVDGLCVSGSAPCGAGPCDDAIDQCLSGTCPPPSVVAEGSRYVAVTPPAGALPVALWVGGSPSDPVTHCVQGYVQADGTVGVDPVFRTASEWGTAHVHGLELVAAADYEFRTDCGDAANADLSFSSPATTWNLGDADQSGFANLGDALLGILVIEDPESGSLEATDIAPCSPNGITNLEDVLGFVLAVEGQQIACPTLCP